MLQKLTFKMCVIQIKMEMKHKAAGKYEMWHILIFCAAQWLAIYFIICLYSKDTYFVHLQIQDVQIQLLIIMMLLLL